MLCWFKANIFSDFRGSQIGSDLSTASPQAGAFSPGDYCWNACTPDNWVSHKYTAHGCKPRLFTATLQRPPESPTAAPRAGRARAAQRRAAAREAPGTPHHRHLRTARSSAGAAEPGGPCRCWVTPARHRRRGASGCRGAAPAAAQRTVCRAGDFSREIFGGSAGSGAGGQRVCLGLKANQRRARHCQRAL